MSLQWMIWCNCSTFKQQSGGSWSQAGNCRDWHSLQNQLCDAIKDGMVTKNHMFCVEEPGVMEIKSDDLAKEMFLQTAMDHKCRSRRKELLGKVVDEMDVVDNNKGCSLKMSKAPRAFERKQIEMGQSVVESLFHMSA